MAKRETKEVVKQILLSLATSPKSIHEIAKNCSCNWESVMNYLESMRDSGIVQEIKEGNKRMFSLIKNNVNRRPDTYFGLPLDSKKEKLIDSLYAKIKEEWIKVKGVAPGKLQVQKTLCRVNKDCKLGLPIGWYQFGALCVKLYDPKLTYDYSNLQQTVLKRVTEVVADYSKEPFAYKLKLRQYVEENKELYKTKEFVMFLITSSDFSKQHLTKLHKYLYDLLKYAPATNDKETDDLLNEFVSLVTKLTTTLSGDGFKELRIEVISAFEKIWKLIALHQYKNDLEEFYSKDVLELFIGLDIKLQKMDVADTLSFLNDFLPEEQEPQDKEYQKIKKFLSSGKELSEEEKNARERKLEKIRKEKGEKGVQEYLSKEFKL